MVCLDIRLNLAGRAIDLTQPLWLGSHPTQGCFLVTETPSQLQFSPNVLTQQYAVIRYKAVVRLLVVGFISALKHGAFSSNFRKITGAAIDIGRVLLDDRGSAGIGSPTTMRSLSDQDILEEKLASEMVAAARFRNVLADIYGETIDHDVVYVALVDLERYREFIHAIRDHLDREGVFEDA